MTSNFSRFLLSSSVLLLLSSSSLAFADQLDCEVLKRQPSTHDQGWKTSAYVLTPKLALTLTSCWESAGSGRIDVMNAAQVWQDGKVILSQNLLSGIIDGGGSADVKSGTVTFSFGCGDREVSKTCTADWKYSAKDKVFHTKTDTLDQHLGAYQKNLKSGDISSAAKSLMSASANLPVASNSHFYAEKHQEILEAGYSAVMKAYKKKDGAKAAQLSATTLDVLGSIALYENQTTLSASIWSLMIEPKDRIWKFSKSVPNALPLALEKTEKNAQMLNDLAFVLAETKAPGNLLRAIPILDQVATAFNGRAVVFLNLGDAYWDLGQSNPTSPNWQKLMRQNYERYKALSKKTPSHVADRLR